MIELTKGIEHLTLGDLSEFGVLAGLTVLEARPLIKKFMEKHKISMSEAKSAYRIYLFIAE